MPTVSTSVGKLVYIASELIQALDMGFQVPFDEMKTSMQSEKVFEVLDKYKDKMDLSLLSPEDRDYVAKNVADIAPGV